MGSELQEICQGRRKFSSVNPQLPTSQTAKCVPVCSVLYGSLTENPGIIELEGANPSAEEGGDEDYSGEGGGEMVHDIEVSFQLHWLKLDENGHETKPPKEQFKAHLKCRLNLIWAVSTHSPAAQAISFLRKIC